MLEKNAALKTRIADLKAENANDQKQSEQRQAQLGQIMKQVRAEVNAHFTALDKQMTNDREFGLKYYAAARSEVGMQYGPFSRLRQLTKEQADALAEALFLQRLRHEKADADKRAGGSNADARAAKAGADAEFAATVQEVLGADSYEQFQLYERQRQAWDYTSVFGGMLSVVDMPLSLEQASQFAAALANANPAFQRGEPVNLQRERTDWDAVDAAAAEFLTPAQLNFLKTVDVSSFGGAFDFFSSQQGQGYTWSLQNPSSE